MTAGEKMLLERKENARLIDTLASRIRQMQDRECDGDALIEGLSLKSRESLSKPAYSATSNSAEHIAVRYEEQLHKERYELSTELDALIRKYGAVKEKLNLYDAVLLGMYDNERAFIHDYFEAGKSLDSIARDKDVSKTTVHRYKKSIIDHFDRILDMIT
jgi:DNA-directed RNA polymerase specialized sigma subunit